MNELTPSWQHARLFLTGDRMPEFIPNPHLSYPPGSWKGRGRRTGESVELSIFLSYSHSDKAIAQEIARGLAARNVRVWIDEGELRVGDSIIERISEALDEVHFVVALVSPNSISSPWCKKELSLAMTGGLRRKGVKVLPLKVGDVAMPTALSDVLYLDVNPEKPRQVVDRLVRDAMLHQQEYDRPD